MPESETGRENKGQKIKIDVLVTGPGGSLEFKTVEVSRGEAKKLVEVEKDPVIKHNLLKELKEKKLI